jgi:serine/threonine protein kinase
VSEREPATCRVRLESARLSIARGVRAARAPIASGARLWAVSLPVPQVFARGIVVDLSAYVLERLHEDDQFILYRGHADRGDPPSILLLAPGSTHPTLETLKKIDHEYALRGELDAAWATRPLALSRYREQLALVRADHGGEPLSGLIRGPMEIRQFLRIALGLAAALRALHQRQLIHKDVKPSNILVDSVSGQSWLTGFGIASQLPRERQAPAPPEFIAGSLPYMAPEQTGRMNRSIDSRSDLYSFGVSLYEMLTGQLPIHGLRCNGMGPLSRCQGANTPG